jgi:mRNA interferase RelE/StbE
VPYLVEFLRSAVRELESLPKSRQRQLAGQIDALAEDPYQAAGVSKLEGEEKLYRKRVGDYRILFEIDSTKKVVTIAKIGHRSDVYRRR